MQQEILEEGDDEEHDMEEVIDTEDPEPEEEHLLPEEVDELIEEIFGTAPEEEEDEEDEEADELMDEIIGTNSTKTVDRIF